MIELGEERTMPCGAPDPLESGDDEQDATERGLGYSYNLVPIPMAAEVPQPVGTALRSE